MAESEQTQVIQPKKKMGFGQKADYNFSCYSCIFGRMLADDCSSE